MRLKGLYLVMVASLSLGACAAPSYSDLTVQYTSNAENLRNDNANMATKIQDKIMLYYPSSEVKVFANDFNVLILGEVKTTNIKDQITVLAQSEHSIKEVWNYVTVNPKPNFKLNKSVITEVRGRIVLEKNLMPDNVEVEAVGSTVYLMGRNIGNLTYFDRAIRGIYMLEGVDKVVNLTRKGPDDYRSKEDSGF